MTLANTDTQRKLDQIQRFGVVASELLEDRNLPKPIRLAETLGTLQDLLAPEDFAGLVHKTHTLLVHLLGGTLEPTSVGTSVPANAPTAPGTTEPPPATAPAAKPRRAKSPAAPTLVEEPISDEEKRAAESALATPVPSVPATRPALNPAPPPPPLEALAPVPPPMPSTVPANGKAVDLSAQIELTNRLAQNRITFDDFARWGESRFGNGNNATGFIDWPDVHGFMQLKTKACNWFLANIYDILDQIKEMKDSHAARKTVAETLL